MKKCLFVVNINNYMPEVCTLTMPTIEKYARKIGAEVKVISERIYANVSVTYEKAQIHALGADNNWNVLIDADIAIGNGFPDVTAIVPPTRVGVHMAYTASQHFPCDMYFKRDARDVAIASDIMAVPHACHDVWTPLEGDPASYQIRRPFILDEYCFSRNLAKFGLKFCGVVPDESMIFHLNHGSSGGRSLDELKEFVKCSC
jgi:hypothetical protein